MLGPPERGGGYVSVDEAEGVDALEPLEQLAHDDTHDGGLPLGGVGGLFLPAQHDGLQAVRKLPQLALQTTALPWYHVPKRGET